MKETMRNCEENYLLDNILVILQKLLDDDNNEKQNIPKNVLITLERVLNTLEKRKMY